MKPNASIGDVDDNGESALQTSPVSFGARQPRAKRQHLLIDGVRLFSVEGYRQAAWLVGVTPAGTVWLAYAEDTAAILVERLRAMHAEHGVKRSARSEWVQVLKAGVALRGATLNEWLDEREKRVQRWGF